MCWHTGQSLPADPMPPQRGPGSKSRSCCPEKAVGLMALPAHPGRWGLTSSFSEVPHSQPSTDIWGWVVSVWAIRSGVESSVPGLHPSDASDVPERRIVGSIAYCFRPLWGSRVILVENDRNEDTDGWMGREGDGWINRKMDGLG